jgi:hypothetical protein
VLQGDKVLLNRRCEPAAQPALEGFARELVRFGSSVDDSRSLTPLLELGEYDNRLDKLFGNGAPR